MGIHSGNFVKIPENKLLQKKYLLSSLLEARSLFCSPTNVGTLGTGKVLSSKKCSLKCYYLALIKMAINAYICGKEEVEEELGEDESESSSADIINYFSSKVLLSTLKKLSILCVKCLYVGRRRTRKSGGARVREFIR